MTDDDAVYVIADTHLGLREWGGKQSRDDPVSVASFLRWLAQIPEAGLRIPVLGPSGVEEKMLKPPTLLILLGDILELWDSENQTLLLSAASVLPSISSFPAEIVYVLGNHDNILAVSGGAYAIGRRAMQVLPDTYPPPAADGTVKPMRIGERSYLFLHGHQLDRFFMASRGTWKWLGHIRHIGAAMGSYAWVFAALVLLTGISLFAVAPIVALWFLVATLVLLVFPRGYMTIARPLYDLRGLRYRRTRARKGLRKWWSRFRGNVLGAEGVSLVYGHTHVLDFFREGASSGTKQPRAPEGEIRSELPEDREAPGNPAYNISSWISAQGGYETLTRATAVYVDASGPLFLGWDWSRRVPFHIPRACVAVRPVRRLTPSEADLVRRLRWPEKLIEKWSRTNEKVPGRKRTNPPSGRGRDAAKG